VSGGIWRAWPPRPDLSPWGCLSPADTQRLSELEYVVVDVETTGGGLTRGHRVTEIALIRVDARGRMLDQYATLVNPERRIPPFISRLTNITNEMVAGAPRFGEIAGEVGRLLAGAVFVAHNAGFDLGFVSGELARARLRASWDAWGTGARDEPAPAPRARPRTGQEVPVAPVQDGEGGLALVRAALQAAGYGLVRREDGTPSVLVVRERPLPDGSEEAAPPAVVTVSTAAAPPVTPLRYAPPAAPAPRGATRTTALCTVRMARRLVPEVPRRSLDVLTDFFGLENDARHRAYGDALVTAAVFGRLMDRLDEREIRSWGELQGLLNSRPPRRKRRARPMPMDDA
jgi:DNA polymerase III epsilon subunit-like protein